MQILDGRQSFYQWDMNQKITSTKFKVGDEIHFHNIKHSEALVTVAYSLNGKVVADVPNILLMTSSPIIAYLYIVNEAVGQTIYEHTFKVEQRAKPSDYLYTETEVLTVTTAVNKALEDAKNSGEFDGKDGQDGKDGRDGVNGEDGYTPIKGVDYYTEAEKQEIVEEVNKHIDEVGYATEEYVDKAVDEVAVILEKPSPNLINPKDLTVGYWTTNSLQTSSNYAGWVSTDKIEITGTLLQSNVPINSIIFWNAADTTDKTNSQALLNNEVSLPITIPSTAKYFAVSFKKKYLDSNIMMNFGDELLPYTPYSEADVPVIKDEFLKTNPKRAKINYASTAENYLSDYKQALAKNVAVSYTANFSEFTKLSIGFTSGTDYTSGYTDYFEITNTDLVMHRKGYNDVSWGHGLTIEDVIGISLKFDIAKSFTLTITTRGGTFSKSNTIYLGKSYYPFAVIEATNVVNNKLSMTCADLDKPIFLFGDSYLSNSSARWIYYLENKDKICLDQYAGESSASAIVDFRTLVEIGSPKFVVWCLGMNDKSDTDVNTPSANWLPYVEEVISTCESHNIVPILATIPNVPSINHDAKNKWVRESGYGYIDFAAAVNPNGGSTWYEGLLSTDNVHPTSDGAKVLYAKAITDFPVLQ